MWKIPQFSIAGIFLALRCIEAEEKQGRKRQKEKKTGKEKNNFTAIQKVAVNFGCCFYKTGGKSDIFD